MGRWVLVALGLLVITLPLPAQTLPAQPALSPGGYLEAEDVEMFENITKQQVTTDSGPGRITLWWNAAIVFPLSVSEAGLYKLLIGAWGNIAKSPDGQEFPLMQLKVDNQVQCEWDVLSEKFIYVSTPLELASGTYQVKISFVNDWHDPNTGKDRDLFLVGIACGAIQKAEETPLVMFKGKPAADYGDKDGNFFEGRPLKKPAAPAQP